MRTDLRYPGFPCPRAAVGLGREREESYPPEGRSAKRGIVVLVAKRLSSVSIANSQASSGRVPDGGEGKGGIGNKWHVRRRGREYTEYPQGGGRVEVVTASRGT